MKTNALESKIKNKNSTENIKQTATIQNDIVRMFCNTISTRTRLENMSQNTNNATKNEKKRQHANEFG